MSKLVKVFAIAALIAGAFAMTPGPAAAQRHGGGGHGGFHSGGGWHGGGGFRGGGFRGGGFRGGGFRGGGWGPGFVFGLGSAYGWGGYPYGYYDDYYAAPNCGWAPVRRWHNHHWVLRRAWRCW